MVKRRKKNSRENGRSKGFCEAGARARNINASTEVSPFGGLLGLIKFWIFLISRRISMKHS